MSTNQHSLTQIANGAGFRFDISHAQGTQFSNPQAHVAAINAGTQNLAVAHDIRQSVQASMGEPSESASTSMGMSGMLAQNVGAGLLTAGLTAVGLGPLGMGIAGISAFNTIRSGLKGHDDGSSYFKSFGAKGEEVDELTLTDSSSSYASYADEAVPVLQPLQQGIPQQGIQEATHTVVNKMGQEDFFADMQELSQEEIASFNMIKYHDEQLGIINGGQQLNVAASYPTFKPPVLGLG